jgi:uncharacterized protein (DUF488 family)
MPASKYGGPEVKKQRKEFFTLGYAAHTVASMLELLSKNRIELLIDVRENPVSRKAGFSAAKLEAELARSGIQYAHFACLGTPTDIRMQYQKNGNALAALTAYEKYLDSRTSYLESLIQFASPRRFCLMCLESDHSLCHRGVIAQKLAEMTRCHPIHLA